MSSLAIRPTEASARARVAARARWGEPRVIRLDSLKPAQRTLILALIDAVKAVPAVASAGTANAEGQTNDRPAA